MESIIQSILKANPSLPQKNFTLAKLTGEASYREYYRVTFAGGPTMVIMKIPVGYASISEEVTQSSCKIDEPSFINVQRYLASLGLPVPEILHYETSQGMIFLTDLGDRMMESHVRGAAPDEQTRIYKKAIHLLVQLQKATRAHRDERCIAFHRRFDTELLFWEFNHFLEYGIEDRLKIKLGTKERGVFESLGRRLVGEVMKIPQCFVHRDFQSRNIMVSRDDFYLIDFQDALMGPVVYDLVALLRDSYIELGQDQRALLMDAYSEAMGKAGPYPHGERAQLARAFDLLTIQRKLKDAGRFQYIHTVKKNSQFLKHAPTSLAYVREAIGRSPAFAELGPMIGKYLPEFQ